MRPAKSVALLLLLLLFTAAQGIRLEGELSSVFQRKLQEEKNRTPTGGGTHLCGEGGQQCSGRSEKPLTAATAGHKSTRSEGTEHGGSERLRPKEQVVGLPASPAASGHSPSAPEPYPDIIDIAGMDYSPARRKAPIHN